MSLALRPADDLEPGRARVLARIEPDAPADTALPYHLESLPPAERWALRKGIVTIGRDPVCEVHLAGPEVQAKRLVSGQHAYLQCDEGQVWLFDGSPAGGASFDSNWRSRTVTQWTPQSG